MRQPDSFKLSSPASPLGWFAAGLLYASILLATVVVLALQQPWLGLQLRWSEAAQGAEVVAATGSAAAIPVGIVLTKIESAGPAPGQPVGQMAFEAQDFVQEPAAGLKTLSGYDLFLNRQGALSALQARAEVRFIDSMGQAYPVQPASGRPVGDLPTEFWVQLVVGFLAWMISLGVWIFRRQESSARYLLLSGWSTLLFAPFAAVYSTRELALPAGLFRVLCDLNFLGGCLYMATMLALLWVYPRKLGRLAWGPLVVAAYLVWWLVQELRLVDSMLVARRSLVFAGLIATVALAVMQWRETRRDPVARAALQWFLISWLLGSGVFAALNFVPQIFGVSMAAVQGFSFSLFLLVYGGLAFGILRYRLFELGQWWVRILLWVACACVFVALDLALLASLHLSPNASLGLSLLICGFLWLPMRRWLWQRIVQRKQPLRQTLFRSVLDVSLAVSAEERLTRRMQLLQSMFNPLHIDILQTSPEQPVVADDGLALLLPAGGYGPGLALRYPGGGRKLFAPSDLALAHEVVDMLRYADSRREAYSQGAQEERARIARDLHDDVGSRLLSSLHQKSIEQTRQVVQQAISEMCTIISGLSGTRMPLGAVIAELRHETARRLEAADLALDWPLQDDHEGVVLTYPILRHVMAIVRELVSNVLRHAGAKTVLVQMRYNSGELQVVVSDDGCGLNDSSSGGNGMNNLKSRTAELRGHIEFKSDERGTEVSVRIPIPTTDIRAS